MRTMKLAEFISNYLKTHAMSYRSFAARSGLTSGYISMLVNDRNPKTGKPPVPSVVTYNNLARAMGMSIDELFASIDNAPVSLSKVDTNLINDGSLYEGEVRRVPILGDTAAGTPIVAERVYDEYIELPADGKRYDAAVHITGDSMEPTYNMGDLALLRYQPDVEDGEAAVVCIDDSVTLKRVYHVSGGLMLQSDNVKYKPIFINGRSHTSVHLIGKVVGYLRWEE